MKKALALVLSSLMILTMLAALVVPVAAEVEGPFVVYADASEYRDDFDPDEDSYSPCAGYYYDDDGLHTTSPNWSKHTPALGIQTRDTVNLKEGVYIQIRIDKFTYANDKWMTFTIYDTQYVQVGSTNTAKDGEGLTALMRPSDEGKIGLTQWQQANFQWGGQNSYDANEASFYDEDGNLLLEFVVTWDDANNTYKVTYNGAEAPATTITWLNEKFGADDRAYIGFNTMNKNLGGELEVTVLKWGKTKASATAPFGEDSKDPFDVEKIIAEIADPSTVPEGQPAIFMNGSKEDSDSKSSVKNDGGLSTLTPENYIHYASDRAHLEIGFAPKNEISYDIQDFPIVVVLTKNFCTCDSIDGLCYAYETANMYLMTGDNVAAGPACKIEMINMCYEPITVGNDSYLYFYVDAANDPTWTAEGRFHGARFDVNDINLEEVGRNEFDVCFMALFRTLEEAEAYINEFVGATDPVEPPVVDTDETDPGENTEVNTEVNTEKTPEKDPEKDPEQKPETENNDDVADLEGGCASVVGFGAVAIVAIAAVAGFVTFKKKD